MFCCEMCKAIRQQFFFSCYFFSNLLGWRALPRLPDIHMGLTSQPAKKEHRVRVTKGNGTDDARRGDSQDPRECDTVPASG